MKKYGQFIYTISEWIMKLAWIHLLWIIFTFTGLIFIGFLPSTVALYSITRKWIQGKTDFPVFQTYWQIYKKEFFRANQLLLAIVPLTALTAADILFLTQSTTMTAVHIPVLVSIIFFILFFLYLIPAFVHFDVPFIQLLKNAFLIMLISPLHDLLLFVSITSLAVIYWYLPGIPFFFGTSLLAWINVWIVLHAFNRVLQKKKSAA